jgi:hypothetical protein
MDLIMPSSSSKIKIRKLFDIFGEFLIRIKAPPTIPSEKIPYLEVLGSYN